MNIDFQLLQRLRQPLFFAAILALAAAAIAYAGFESRASARAEHDAALGRHRQSEARLRHTLASEPDIQDRARQHQRLQSLGFIGAEKRLDWTELLHDLQQRMALPDLNYEFAPRRPLANHDGSAPGFQASAMKLRLQLVHEEDLLAFLHSLHKEAKALVLLRRCLLMRAPRGPAPAPSLSSLDVECDMDWITAQDVGSATP